MKTPEQIQADKNLSKILKQEIVLFSRNELDFMVECLTSLKYDETDTSDEKDYNKKLSTLLNKISRLQK